MESLVSEGKETHTKNQGGLYVAEANLHRGTYAALVVAAEVVAEPDERDGLGDIAASHDQEDGEVPHADCDLVHGQ